MWLDDLIDRINERLARIPPIIVGTGVTALIIALLHGAGIRTILPSGDDVILIAQAPKNTVQVWNRMLSFTIPYQPVTHLVFALYRSLSPYTPFVFLVHLALVSLLGGLLYRMLSRIIDPVYALALTIVPFLNPVFLTALFSLASLPRVLLLLSFLLLANIFEFPTAGIPSRKRVYGALFIGIISAGIDSGSLFILPIALLVLKQNSLRTKDFLIFASLILLPFAGGVIMIYRSLPLLTLQYLPQTDLVIHNLKSAGFWLSNYPFSSTYGFQEGFTILTYGISILSGAIFGMALVIVLIKNPKEWMFLVSTTLLSGIPSLFLRQFTPPYADVALILSLIALALAMSVMVEPLPRFVVSIAILTAGIYFLLTTYPLLQKSPIITAQQKAQSFIQYTTSGSYQAVCIINSENGEREIGYGSLLSIMGSQIPIFISPDTSSALQCQTDGLILKPTHAEYLKIQ